MKKMAVLTRSLPHSFYDGKWHYKTETVKVRVMAEAEGFAMVRQIIDGAKCMPFVCQIRQLKPQE